MEDIRRYQNNWKEKQIIDKVEEKNSKMHRQICTVSTDNVEEENSNLIDHARLLWFTNTWFAEAGDNVETLIHSYNEIKGFVENYHN